MIFVLEIQKMSEDSAPHILTTANTVEEAESKYHTVLAAAAVSSVPVHSVVLISDEGVPIKYDRYRHKIKEENAE